MIKDEKFVKEHWLGVYQGKVTRRIYRNGLDMIPNQISCLDWATAAEFTRQRLEEIRQVEEEIVLINEAKEILDADVNPNWMPRIQRQLKWQSILAREQKILASLRRGMKEPQP